MLCGSGVEGIPVMQLWREILNVCGRQWTAERACRRMKRLSSPFLVLLSSIEVEMREGVVELEIGDCRILSVMFISCSIGRRGMP